MGGHPEENMTLNSIFFYSSPTEILIFCILGGGGGGGILNAHAGSLVRFSAAICGKEHCITTPKTAV